MAEARKIFPIEQVMELAAGRDGASTGAIASHILGRQVTTPQESEAAAPFAAAWLGRLYPRFLDMEWHAGGSFDELVKRAKGKLGEHISIEPMTGRMKELANQALDNLSEAQANMRRQMDVAAKLEQKVKELAPLEALTSSLRKKNDDLESKIKAMKTEMGVLQRKVNEFQGKLAIDHQELMQNIKDAIKDGLKGLALGGATAAAPQPEDKPETGKPLDDFGFGDTGADADGFGF